MTQGGAESVLECVGNEPSMATVIAIARPAGAIGYVDVPHGRGHNFNLERLLMNNITLGGKAVPARAYIR